MEAVAVVAHAFDSGPVTVSIHVPSNPIYKKLDTNPDVDACT